ncbi:hypothetical protein MPTK1_5g04975 [Marchantia polymorpha subsp. ruderalis]
MGWGNKGPLRIMGPSNDNWIRHVNFAFVIKHPSNSLAGDTRRREPASKGIQNLEIRPQIPLEDEDKRRRRHHLPSSSTSEALQHLSIRQLHILPCSPRQHDRSPPVLITHT